MTINEAGGVEAGGVYESNVKGRGLSGIVLVADDGPKPLWECKNYEKLSADDFHQAAYYINQKVGRFIIVVCRAKEPFPSSVYEHVKRVSAQSGLVLLLRESDLRTFLRQALNGKRSEQHIQDIFDRTERLVS